MTACDYLTQIMTNLLKNLWETLKTRYRKDPAGFTVSALILVVMLIGILWLRDAPKPWEEGVVERLAQGKKPTEKHYVTTYSWVAGAANVFFLGILLACKRFWWRQCEPLVKDAQAMRDFVPRADSRWVFWGMVGLAVVIAGLTAWPRMSHNLWGDEEYTFRRNVHGDWRWNEQGELEFVKIDWLKTAFGYRMPNNHLVQTILSRLAHDWWLANVWEPGQVEVDERVVRWPAYLFGLATIPLLALLLARLGHCRAGPAAAILLAVHPWFIRYISEMRGYAMIIFFVVLLLLLAVEALRSTQWRWWLAFGFCQFLMMWTNVLSIYVPLALNVIIFLLFIMRRADTQWWQGQAARWVVVNILSAMLFFQVMLPNLPWLVEYVSKHQNTPRGTGPDWYADFAGYMLGGMDWTWRGGDTPAYMNWTKALTKMSLPINVLGWVTLALLVSCLIYGIWLSRKQREQDPFMPMVAITLLMAPLLCIMHELVADEYFYFWYLIFALPMVPFFVGLGAEGFFQRMCKSAGQKAGIAVPSLVLLGIVGGFFALTIHPLQTKYPVEPLRVTAEYMRGDLEPYPPEEEKVITAGFMMVTPVYNPAYHHVVSVEELRDLMERARRENKPLYVAFGHYGFAEVAFPEIVALVENPEVFQKEKVFHGTWPQLDRHVFRMIELGENTRTGK